MAQAYLIFLIPLIFGVFSWLSCTLIMKRSSLNTDNHLENQIDALLPQTQCGKCNYDGCRPYARAIATGEADINKCPPGGSETIKLIASLLGRDSVALDSEHLPLEQAQVALIDEQVCIGCVKCIMACPVDAIVGTAKQMHTVIEDLCTDCGLCIPPCPVNCISMVPVHFEIKKWVWIKPQANFEASL